jgi:hypothetical protein
VRNTFGYVRASPETASSVGFVWQFISFDSVVLLRFVERSIQGASAEGKQLDFPSEVSCEEKSVLSTERGHDKRRNSIF